MPCCYLMACNWFCWRKTVPPAEQYHHQHHFHTSIDMNDSGAWYTSPWVWVVGAAVFILLLIALLRGGGGTNRTDASSTDRVTVTKTVERDRDTDVV